MLCPGLLSPVLPVGRAARPGDLLGRWAQFGHAEIIYRQRLAVLERAQRSGNVAEACPDAAPTCVLEALLTLVVLQPTLGCRRFADLLAEQSFSTAHRAKDTSWSTSTV